MAPKLRSAPLSKLGEFQLIQSIPEDFIQREYGSTISIGDDAAILRSSLQEQLVISTDLLVEDIHFTRKTSTFYNIGYKAAAVNLSDMAAMGANPTNLLVSIALPPALTTHDWQEFYRGLAAPCKPYNVKLLGGDTSSSPTSLFIAISITGLVKPRHILTRHGAKIGDLLYTSGTLGDSAAGLAYLKKRTKPPKLSALSKGMNFLVLRHMRPTARITLGQLLASQPYASAAMDLSDGLSGDLNHLCRLSQVGALIYSEHIPMSEPMQNYAKRLRTPPLHWSLLGGEDYELLFTINPKWQKELEKTAKRRRIPISQIGVIQPKGLGIRIEYKDGTQHPLPSQGYEHFSS